VVDRPGPGAGAIVDPVWNFGRDLDADEARELYRQRLDRHAESVISNLARLARQHPDQALCVLCFEDVLAGQPCHRRWFAEWFEERYRITVAELSADQPRLPF
jgi:hypothetical protein